MTTAGSIAAEKYSKMGCRSWLTLLSCRHTRRFQNPLRFLTLSSLTVLLLSRGPTTQILMAHVHAHQYNVTNRDKNLIYSQLFLGESDDHYQVRLSLKWRPAVDLFSSLFASLEVRGTSITRCLNFHHNIVTVPSQEAV